MKKFFSLICAIAIVFSATAAPVSKKDLADKKVVKKEIRYQQGIKKAPAKAVAFKSLEKTAAPKWVEKKAGVKEFKAVKAIKSDVAKVLKAKKETFNLTFESEDAEFDWTDAVADEGWWQFQAEDEDFYLSLSNVETEEVAGTYAWEDMDPDWTGLYSIAVGDYVELVDCNITLATPAGENFTLIITGSLEDADGNIYNLNITYEEEIPEPVIIPAGGEFECDTVSSTFYSSDNDVWYKMTLDEFDSDFRFDIVVAEGLRDVEPGKIYTLDSDMIADYSYAYLGDAQMTYLSASFVKTFNEDGSADINATVLDADSSLWILHYAVPAPPVAESFDTIVANVTYTSEPYWFWTLYTFEAADARNSIVLSIMPGDSFIGSWIAPDDISGAVTPVDGEESEIVSGEVTFTATADGFKITGAVLCANLVEYTLDLTYVIPDPTRQAEYTLSGLELVLYEGAWQLSGFSEDGSKYATIAASADSVSGQYTQADLLADYSVLYDGIVYEGDSIVALNEYTLLKANLNVVFNEADSTIVITGTFRGQNGEDIPEFALNLSGRIPAPEVSNMTFEFNVDSVGITVIPSNNDPWDWFVVNEATFEYYGADGVAEAIYGNYGNTYAVTGSQIFAWDDEDLTYYCSEGGTFYFIVWGSGESNITTEAAYVVFEYESSVPEGCTQYDAIDENFVVNFANYNVDDQYLAQYGVLIVEAQDAQNNYISLEMNVSAIVPGVYNIGEEEDVAAGSIDQYIYGSFAGVLTSDGNINVPLWCLVAGTVTVNEDLSIDVDAVNCAGAEIKSHMANGGAQGVENAEAAKVANKRIVNGQLVIEKNGVRFNAIGTIVK
jgi:hypothetical protein